MLEANSPGRPTGLTKEIHDRLVEAASQVIIPAQVAALSRIPKSTLSDWLKKGEADALSGIDSVYAQLSYDFKEAQAKVVLETISFLRNCPRNYQALTWLLERCFRKDFGADSEEIRELICNLDLISRGMRGGINGEAKSEDTE